MRKSNEMKRIIFAILVGFALLLSAGCVRRPGGIAASNIPLAPGEYTPIGQVMASDCSVALLGILPVSGSNYIQDAKASALRKSGGHALVDISIERVFKYFILWSQTCTEIRATAVRVEHIEKAEQAKREERAKQEEAEAEAHGQRNLEANHRAFRESVEQKNAEKELREGK
jgi:hypothetical protein